MLITPHATILHSAIINLDDFYGLKMIAFMKLINIYKSFIFYLMKSVVHTRDFSCWNEYLIFVCVCVSERACDGITVAIKLHFESIPFYYL